MFSLPTEKALLFSAPFDFRSSEKSTETELDHHCCESTLCPNEGPGVQHYERGIICGICGGAFKR